MKKTLLSLAALAFAMTACNSTPEYKINGTVEGEQTGNVYLLKYANQKMDTLAKAPIADGKFTITGSVEGVTDANLVMEGKRSRLPIFLENTTFTVTLNPANPVDNKVEGGATQAIANQIMDIESNAMKLQSELRQQYQEAEEAQDTAKIREIVEKFNNISSETQTKEDSIIKANPDSYIAAYMIASQMNGMEYEELAERYNLLGEKAKASEPGKKISEKMEKLASVAVGKVAPDFTMNTPEGQPLSMHSIKGKVKLIDFWASWCGPCRGENPNVVKIYKEFHPKGLEILSVSLDRSKEDWLKAIEDDQLTWNHVSDLKYWGNEAAQLYGVNGIPHLIVLDENNVIVAKNLRGQELRDKIAELLK